MEGNERRVELVRQAKAGSRDALEQVLWEHFSDLEQYLKPQMPADIQSFVSVEDIISQTFFEAFRDFDGYRDGPGSSITAWLKTIARHRMLDSIRKVRRRSGHTAVPADAMLSSAGDLMALLPDDGPTSSLRSKIDDAEHALRLALEQLPDHYREVIVFRYVEEIGIDEIAERMNRPQGSIRGLLDRAKSELRSSLGAISNFISVR